MTDQAKPDRQDGKDKDDTKPQCNFCFKNIHDHCLTTTEALACLESLPTRDGAEEAGDRWAHLDNADMTGATFKGELSTPPKPAPDAMQEALEPFAKAAVAFDSWPRDMKLPDSSNICTFIPHKGTLADGATINYGDCRQALTALSASVSPADGVGRLSVPFNPCLAKLREGEPFFVLLGRDKQAPNAVMTWANDRQAAEGKSPWTEQAREVAYSMAAYSGASSTASPSGAVAAEPETEQQIEDRLMKQDAGDMLRLIDYIADKIGLPHDEELSRDNFNAWLATPTVRGDRETLLWASGVAAKGAKQCSDGDSDWHKGFRYAAQNTALGIAADLERAALSLPVQSAPDAKSKVYAVLKEYLPQDATLGSIRQDIKEAGIFSEVARLGAGEREAARILRGWAKAYRDTPEHRFPSDPNAEFFPVDLESAADLLDPRQAPHSSSEMKS